MKEIKVIPIEEEKVWKNENFHNEVCRICLGENDENTMIKPCKCTGSVKFVHENCLKIWISSQNSELSEAQCELCSTKFKMTFFYSTRCSNQKLCQNNWRKLMIYPIFIFLQVLIGALIYLLFQRLEETENYWEFSITLVIIFLFFLISLLFIWIIFSNSKRICMKKILKSWVIFPHDECEPIRLNDTTVLEQTYIEEFHKEVISEHNLIN